MSVHTRSSNQAAGSLVSVPVNCTNAIEAKLHKVRGLKRLTWTAGCVQCSTVVYSCDKTTAVIKHLCKQCRWPLSLCLLVCLQV